MKNWQSFVAAVVGEIKVYVGDRMGVLERSIATLDGRMNSLPTPKDGERGRDGTSVTLDDVRPLIAEVVAALPPAKDGRDGVDGKSVTAEDVQPLLAQLVASLPPAPKGEKGERGDPGEKGCPGQDGQRGEQGPQGEPGTAGRDGSDGINGKDGAPGADGKDGARGAQGEPGPAGRDGTDGKDGQPGQRGDPGKDGDRGPPGADGKSITLADVQPILDAAIARMELDAERRGMAAIARAVEKLRDGRDGKDGRDGTNGINGKDGRDCIDFASIDIELGEDFRTLKLVAMAGEQRVERSVHIPVPAFQGVYNSGTKYQRGDIVTFGGSSFIARRDTGSKPEIDDSWTLFTKRGRDGKDGQRGERGEPGRDGRAPR